MAPAPVETRARESLLTPSQRARARSASQASQASIKTTGSASTTNTMDKPSSLADVEMRYREESEMVRAAQEAVMHRPNFAIDAIGDSDGEEEEEGADDGVMDEVEAFLKAHGGEDDTAVKGAAKKEAEGESGPVLCNATGATQGAPQSGAVEAMSLELGADGRSAQGGTFAAWPKATTDEWRSCAAVRARDRRVHV